MLEVGPMELLDLQKQKQNYIFGDIISVNFNFTKNFLHPSACKKILICSAILKNIKKYSQIILFCFEN